MCDEEKIKIKNEMRYEIYRHRYYHDADWSISEEMLCKYESTMNEIVLSDIYKREADFERKRAEDEW